MMVDVVTDRLMDRAADPNLAGTDDGYTALMYAAQEDHLARDYPAAAGSGAGGRPKLGKDRRWDDRADPCCRPGPFGDRAALGFVRSR